MAASSGRTSSARCSSAVTTCAYSTTSRPGAGRTSPASRTTSSSSRATSARTSACTRLSAESRSSSTRARCRPFPARSRIRSRRPRSTSRERSTCCSRHGTKACAGSSTHPRRPCTATPASLPRVETQAPDPISPYAVAKLAAERFCTSFTRVYGMEIVSLRYFNVFGPRQDPTSQYAAVVPRFITAIADGEPVTIYGDGEQSRDFTFVDNVVRGEPARGRRGRCGRRDPQRRDRRVGDGQRARGRDRELLGKPVEKSYEPARDGDVLASWADVSEARRLLGFEPEVDFEDGLRRRPTTSSERTDDDTRIRKARRARRGLRLPQDPRAARRDGVRRERDRHAARLLRLPSLPRHAGRALLRPLGPGAGRGRRRGAPARAGRARPRRVDDATQGVERERGRGSRHARRRRQGRLRRARRAHGRRRRTSRGAPSFGRAEGA